MVFFKYIRVILSFLCLFHRGNSVNFGKENPFIVALYDGSQFISMGVIRNDHTVVTPAHVIDSDKIYSMKCGFDDDDGLVTKAKFITKNFNVAIPPFFDPKTLEYDVSELMSENPMESSGFCSALARPPNFPENGECTALEWLINTDKPHLMMYPLKPNKEFCKEILPETTNTSSILCAEMDHCPNGTIGAPLICHTFVHGLLIKSQCDESTNRAVVAFVNYNSYLRVVNTMSTENKHKIYSNHTEVFVRGGSTSHTMQGLLFLFALITSPYLVE